MADIEMLQTHRGTDVDDVSVKSKYDKDTATVSPAKYHDSKQELHRALTPAQISMIAIGGSIGTGLIISSGQALAQ